MRLLGTGEDTRAGGRPCPHRRRAPWGRPPLAWRRAFRNRGTSPGTAACVPRCSQRRPRMRPAPTSFGLCVRWRIPRGLPCSAHGRPRQARLLLPLHGPRTPAPAPRSTHRRARLPHPASPPRRPRRPRTPPAPGRHAPGASPAGPPPDARPGPPCFSPSNSRPPWTATWPCAWRHTPPCCDRTCSAKATWRDRTGSCPGVLPVVVHTGRERWRAPLGVRALTAPGPEALAPLQPDAAYVLLDGPA